MKTQINEFRREVLAYYKTHSRHTLPWRKTSDPYRILVSEIMLQQTQVDRVRPFYRNFLKKYPTVKVLSKAALSDVLKMWSGLGYNRRAKYLRDAAVAIMTKHQGAFPKANDDLRKLPGVGDYTAKAIRVFAWNMPEILIETNIRTAYLNYFYSSVLPVRRSPGADGQKAAIRDQEIFEKAKEAAKGKDPRVWHWALMDYGASLKRSGILAHRESAHYVKQSKFKGSEREVRGAILRSLGFSSTNEESLKVMLEFPKERFERALLSLYKDGLIEEIDGIVRLALG